jgi:LAGLIDADG endonuclease
MLVGFIDGDGYIGINLTKKKFIKLNLVLSLDIRDLSLLKYIQSIIKIGKINTYSSKVDKKVCKLVIHKSELQNVLFPLLLNYNIFFLTKERRAQYLKALYIMKNNITLYNEIPNSIDESFVNEYYPLSLNKIEDIINLRFFNDWIVGFTIAEGSFIIKSNNDACFQLRQRTHTTLFEAIKLKFKTNVNIY